MDPEETTETTPEAAPEPTEAPIPEPVEGGLEDVPSLTAEDVFNFDPFGEDGTPDVPASEMVDPETGKQIAGAVEEPTPVVPAEPQPEGVAGVGSGAAPVPPPAQPGVGTDWQERAVKAEENVHALMQMLAKQQEAPPAPKAEEPKADDYPNYQFTIPPQIQEMLTSDDPAAQQQALSALISGMGRTVHERLRSEYSERLDQRINQFRERFVQDQANAQQASQVFTDFYNTYPQLNRPELRGLVAAASKAVVAEKGAKQWSAGLRDEIAGRVFAIVNDTVGQPSTPTAEPGAAPATPAPAQSAGNGAAAPRAVPPRMRGTGTRPAAEAPLDPNSQEAHMEDVLRGF